MTSTNHLSRYCITKTRIFAVQSISKAAIKGYCIQGPWEKDSYSSFTAKALAEADAVIDITETKGCVGYVDL
jgi:hypothetical protein